MKTFKQIIESRDWENQQVFDINRLPAHAPLNSYSSTEQALTKGLSDRQLCLNGEWKFMLFPQPEQVPHQVIEPGLDESDWHNMQVPNNWQTQGFDKPIYTNVKYPFENQPPYVPSDNPTGVYRTEFELPQIWQELDTRIIFDGVNSAFHLWCNGFWVAIAKTVAWLLNSISLLISKRAATKLQ